MGPYDDGTREAFGKVWYYDHWEGEDDEPMIRNRDDSLMCNGVKKDGDPCSFKAREGMKTCWRHRTQEEALKRVIREQPAPAPKEEE